MDWSKVARGLGLGALAIIVASAAIALIPDQVAFLNKAMAQAQLVLGFFGIVIGATTIGGAAISNTAADRSAENLRAPALVGGLGALLMAVGFAQASATGLIAP